MYTLIIIIVVNGVLSSDLKIEAIDFSSKQACEVVKKDFNSKHTVAKCYKK